jgi:hypothetical protein
VTAGRKSNPTNTKVQNIVDEKHHHHIAKMAEPQIQVPETDQVENGESSNTTNIAKSALGNITHNYSN